MTVIILSLSGLFFVSQKLSSHGLPRDLGTEKAGNQAIKTILEINGLKYESGLETKTSVYNFMDQLRKEGKINFQEKNYPGLGKLIEELNGVRGNGSEYWIYYVNDKKANIGVSNYKINPGDVVSWKYEKDY